VNPDVPALESRAPPTKNLEAYSLYLQALASGERISDAGDRKAIELLERAIALDPGFARAYLVRAGLRNRLNYPFADMERDAKKAMALDPTLTDEVKLRLFVTAEVKRGNWIAAEETFRTLTPNMRDPNYYLGYTLTVLWPTGQLKRNLEANEAAYRLAPGAGGIAWQLGMANSALGRDAEAIKLADAAVTLGIDPEGRRVKQIYANAAERAERYSEAAKYVTAWFPENIRAAGGTDVAKLVYAAMGDSTRKPAAIAALRGFIPKVKPEDWQFKVAALAWYAQLGAPDLAFELAEQLRTQFADRNPQSAWSWLWNPVMQPFRQDPRFQAFTTRLGLMKYWQKYGPPDDCDLNDGKLACH
jgi:tetratricopeptide (TPR) repeat protein